MADQHEQDLQQELREIQLRVAQLAADLLGADHPFAMQLVSHDRPHGEVAPAESPLGSWPAGVRVHGSVVVITDHDDCC
jgi:hypothetical protein